MSEARERSEWNRTASLLVKLHNTHIADKSDAIGFCDVHPYFILNKIKEPSQEPTYEQLQLLERAFSGGCISN